MKMKLVVDTGGAVSILPPMKISRHFLQSTPVRISSADGENIKTYGEVSLHLKIPRLKMILALVFVVADVTTPLQGHDFVTLVC